ncbi:multiple C2 and transmembrane domain-containing protein 1-like protein [Aphelenchoides avenae]|nr:multiple C2 and transmembrane domain-containing protein 1-like protein [Aphelenchus avenae]
MRLRQQSRDNSGSAQMRRKLNRNQSYANGVQTDSSRNKSQDVCMLGKETGSSQMESDEADYVALQLRVHLKEGHGLVVRDASGSSDPYVRFKHQQKVMYKSNTVFRSLNPNWDEEFAFLVEDPTAPLEIEVFDYDRFMVDDFMGRAVVDLSTLKMKETYDMKLNLEEEGNEEYMGYLHLSVAIIPLTERAKSVFSSKAIRGVVSENPKRNNKAATVWLSVVNIVLVEARLNSLNLTQPPEAYAKFKLNTEKYKSKVAPKSYEPKWVEQFDLHIFDENFQILDVMLHDKTSNTAIGKCAIDLHAHERESTLERWYQLEDDAGSVLLLITVSGTSASESVGNLHDYQYNREQLVQKYDLFRTFGSFRDVGHLAVKVYRAEDLASADIGGKSDPFCVLELVNARLQTHTEYKTLNPVWDKIFTFAVKDIHEALEITVYDEDPNKKFEFLGKVVIPLLKIRNCEKRWYALKDRKLTRRVKGRILLEMDVLWNPLKAAVRTFNPREQKFTAQEPKFKRQLLVDSVNRLRQFWANVTSVREYIRSCLNWESYPRSVIAFATFVTFVYYVEIYHFPLLLLLFFVRYHFYEKLSEGLEQKFRSARSFDERQATESDAEDDLDGLQKRATNASTRSAPASPATPPGNDKTTSLKGRFIAVQDTLTVVQNILDYIASLLERIRNTFNFTVPYLSYLAITVLCIATLLLYFVPLRWIVMAWGVNKFTKKLRNPHYIENNELLDFLSRVPCDRDLRMFHEVRSNCEDSPYAENSTSISSETDRSVSKRK